MWEKCAGVKTCESKAFEVCCKVFQRDKAHTSWLRWNMMKDGRNPGREHQHEVKQTASLVWLCKHRRESLCETIAPTHAALNWTEDFYIQILLENVFHWLHHQLRLMIRSRGTTLSAAWRPDSCLTLAVSLRPRRWVSLLNAARVPLHHTRVCCWS